MTFKLSWRATVAKQTPLEMEYAEAISVAKGICHFLDNRKRRGLSGAGGFVSVCSVLGVTVRYIVRNELDYSIGNDSWRVRFMPTGRVVLRGDAEIFNRDMTMFKMVGSPYGCE